MRPGLERDWKQYAAVLDLYLAGNNLATIALIFGFSRQRASQMLILARAQLGYRVFKGVPRPLPLPPR
jgi:hypothetical protein